MCVLYVRQRLYVGMVVHAFLGCTRAGVCRRDVKVICIGHGLTRCSGSWYVCSVNVEVLVKGRHLVERQYRINIVRMCRLSVP